MIGLLAWTAYSGKAKSDVARLVSEARLMMERGEYRPGLEKAQRALALDPGNHEARLVRARMLMQRVHFPEAAEEARRVLRDDPDNWEVHLVLAVCAKFVPTIDGPAHFAAVESRVPETADAFYLRGWLAESQREKLEWLDRALEAKGNRAGPVLGRPLLRARVAPRGPRRSAGCPRRHGEGSRVSSQLEGS